MAVTEFTCPQCHAHAGTQKAIPFGSLVRCPKCSHVFRLEAPGSAPAAEAPKSAPVMKPAPEPVKPAPAAKSAPAAKASGVTKPAAPAARVVEPARSAAKLTSKRPEPVVAARRARDDDDDDYDRPRSKKRRKKESGGGNGLMIGLIAGGGVLAVLVVGAIIAVVAFSGGDKKKNDVALNPNPIPRGPIINPLDENSTSKPPVKNPPTTPPKDDANAGGGETPILAGGGEVAVADIYKYVLKSTALILNFGKGGELHGGTGEVIDVEDRLMLTNHHVVRDQQKLVVFFPAYDEKGSVIQDKDRYLKVTEEGVRKALETGIPAEVIASSEKQDLALIQLSKLPPGIEALPLAKKHVEVGDKIHSVGNAGVSNNAFVYTTGSVRGSSHTKIPVGDGHKITMTLECEIIETDSPTNEGDSGGPLVNNRGELVGVTEGYSGAGRAISIFVHLREVQAFVGKEYQKKFNREWKPKTRAPLRGGRGAGAADVAGLMKLLDHTDATKRQQAALALGEMGGDAKIAIQRLIKALNDSDITTSRAAFDSLIKIGTPSRDDLLALQTALKDAKPEVKRYAAGAIGQIGPDAANAVDDLLQSATDNDDRVREAAIRSIGSLGTGVKSAAKSPLLKALQDNSKNVRVAAATALTNLMSPPTADDVPDLLTIIKLPDADASIHGAKALAKLGSKASTAVPELLEAAKSGESGTRRSAIDALAAIGPDPKKAAPLYLAAFKDSTDPDLKTSALLALGQLKGFDKEKDKDTINVVLDATKDSDPKIKKAALTAVGNLGPAAITPAGAKIVMPALIDALQSKEDKDRDQVLETISGLGPLAKDAVGPLITIMDKADIKARGTDRIRATIDSKDEQFLEKYAKVLGKIGKPAVTLLIGSLNTSNPNFGLFIGCCKALGEVGPAAKGQNTLATLQGISQSNAPRIVCEEADRALRKIYAK
jgi:HEAT repeat protein